MYYFSKYRPAPILPRNCISPLRGKLHCDTNYSKDYVEYNFYRTREDDEGKMKFNSGDPHSFQILNIRTLPILPKHRISPLRGKIENITRYNKDYPEKNARKISPIFPKHGISPLKGKIENNTRYKNDYLEKYARKISPILPNHNLSPCRGKFHQYTNYNDEFKFMEITSNRSPILPKHGISPPHGKLYAYPSYNAEYQDYDLNMRKITKREPILPTHNLNTNKSKMEDMTTYVNSYNEWLNILLGCSIKSPKRKASFCEYHPENKLQYICEVCDDTKQAIPMETVEEITSEESNEIDNKDKNIDVSETTDIWAISDSDEENIPEKNNLGPTFNELYCKTFFNPFDLFQNIQIIPTYSYKKAFKNKFSKPNIHQTKKKSLKDKVYPIYPRHNLIIQHSPDCTETTYIKSYNKLDYLGELY